MANRGFLPGHEAPWVDERRRWLDDVRLRALECVGTAGLRMGGTEMAAAERAGRASSRAAPFRESGYRLLMEALGAGATSPRRSASTSGLRVLLREELGVAPGRPRRSCTAPAGAAGRRPPERLALAAHL